jgi:hypothetical protein
MWTKLQCLLLAIIFLNKVVERDREEERHGQYMTKATKGSCNEKIELSSNGWNYRAKRDTHAQSNNCSIK